MRRYSTPLIIWESKIKITMTYHLIPIRMAIIRKTKITSVGKNSEEKKTLCMLVGK